MDYSPSIPYLLIIVKLIVIVVEPVDMWKTQKRWQGWLVPVYNP